MVYQEADHRTHLFLRIHPFSRVLAEVIDVGGVSWAETQPWAHRPDNVAP